MPDIRFYENMLFNYETTNRTCFQPEIIYNYTPTVYREKLSRPRPPYKTLRDTHTLTDFKKYDLPTELFANRNVITRAKAPSSSVGIVNPVDEDMALAQATRPRLVMPPSVSMDDIEDSSVRELLIKDVYKSSLNVMQIDVSTESGEYRAPLDGKYSPANPITLPRLQMPVVPAEWRMDSVSWDKRQIRGHCDPNKSFYMSQPLRCEVCQSTTDRQIRNKAKFSNNKFY